jgi:hypothetical protein
VACFPYCGSLISRSAGASWYREFVEQVLLWFRCWSSGSGRTELGLRGTTPTMRTGRLVKIGVGLAVVAVLAWTSAGWYAKRRIVAEITSLVIRRLKSTESNSGCPELDLSTDEFSELPLVPNGFAESLRIDGKAQGPNLCSQLYVRPAVAWLRGARRPRELSSWFGPAGSAPIVNAGIEFHRLALERRIGTVRWQIATPAV